MIELKAELEWYLVSNSVARALPNEVVYAILHLAISRQGVSFLWPVRLPDSSGRINRWHLSAANAAQRAMTQWVRLVSNMALGAYDIFVAETQTPEPEWPDLSFDELLRIAFANGRLIHSLDHPVIKRLRGLV